jgi:hypothetical protein
MDVYGIEALLGLPEFHVIDQVIGPKRLDLSLERRDTCIVCPRCQTCCSRVKESRPRCIRDGSCWIPGSWMCRWRTTRLLSPSPP